jgi:hypothetical protein
MDRVKTICRAVLLAFILAPLSGAKLAAQSMPCDTATAILSHPDGVSNTKLMTAANRIVRCGDLAPPAIMKLFRTSADKSALDSLATYSAWLLGDERLADSVGALAKNPNVVVGKRLSALQLLIRYVSRASVLIPDGARKDAPWVLGVVTDSDLFSGNQPIEASGRTRALSVIKWMGVNEPNSDVRRLARIAGENLDKLLAKGG